MNQTLAVTKIEAVEEIGPGIFEVRVLLEDASTATLRMNGSTLCSLADMVSVIDVIGSMLVFSGRPVLNALASAIVFAVIFGFLVYYGYGRVEMSVSTTPEPTAPAQTPPSAPAPTPQ